MVFSSKQNIINGKSITLLSDYLNAKTKAVFADCDFSNNKQITDCVPQSSVLRPLLYIIYTVLLICGNDIADNLLSITRQFAANSSFAPS